MLANRSEHRNQSLIKSAHPTCAPAGGSNAKNLRPGSLATKGCPGRSFLCILAAFSRSPKTLMRSRFPNTLPFAAWWARCPPLALLAAGGAAAATIPGLFNTGVDGAGVILAQQRRGPALSPHSSAPTRRPPGPSAFVVIDTLFPIVSGPWLATSPQSKWIGPKADQSVGSSQGDYVYRISFDLTDWTRERRSSPSAGLRTTWDRNLRLNGREHGDHRRTAISGRSPRCSR